MPDRADPFGAFRFKVEIDNVLVAGFSEVTGLEIEMEVEEYREGGLNSHPHYFPKFMKYPRLVLKSGVVADAGTLWTWYENNLKKITLKDGSIILCDNKGEEARRWSFFKAYPVKWTGPQLKADSSAVAVDTFELVHGGLKRVK